MDGTEPLNGFRESTEAPIFTIIVGKQGNLTFAGANPAFEAITGLCIQDLAGMRIDEAPGLTAESAAALEASCRRCLERGEDVLLEKPLVFGGAAKWPLTQLSPLRDEKGRLTRIIGLGLAAVKAARAEEKMKRSEWREAAQARIANIFLTVPDEAMYGEALAVVIEATESQFGAFGYIADNGDLVMPSMTRGVWDECQVPEKSITFPASTWGESLWGRAIREQKTFCSDGPFHTPKGHIHIDHFLTTPIVYGSKTIGLLSVANRTQGYTDECVALLENIAAHISPILNARVQRDRQAEERKRAEKALQDANDLLRAIIEAAPVAIIGLDLDGKVRTVWNPAAERMLGWRAEEAMGRYLPSVPLEKEEEFQRFRERIRAGLTLNGVEVSRQKRDGAPIDYAIYAAPLHDAEGRISGNIAVLVETTQRKRAEEALRESERRYKQLLGSVTDYIYTVQVENGRAVSTVHGPGCAAVTGYTPEDYAADPYLWLRMVHEPDRPAVTEQAARLLSGEAVELLEHRLIHRDGSLRWVRHTTVPRYDEHRTLIAYDGLIEDITERKQVEEVQRRLNRELLAISSCNQLLMRAVDEQTLLDEVCHIICDVAGYRMAWVGYAERDEAKTVRPVAWAGLDSGYVADARLSWAEDTERGQGPAGIAIRSGSAVYVQDFATDPRMAPWRENALQRGYRSGIALPLKDENETVFGVLLIYSAEPNAITPDEIRLMEELANDLVFGIVSLRVRAGQKRNEDINASRLHLAQFSLSHSLDELLEETLNEAEKLTGSLIGFFHFVEADQKSLTLQNWSTRTKREFCRAEGKGLHYAISEAGVWVDCIYQRGPVIHNDYASLPHRRGMPKGHAAVIRELVVPVFRGEKATAILGVGNKPTDYTQADVETVSLLADLVWEIAERKRADDSLRKSEEKWRLLYENLPGGSYIVNKDQIIEDVNDVLCVLTGYQREELVGQSCSVICPKGPCKCPILDLGKPYIDNDETTIKTKDGRLIPILKSARKIPIAEKEVIVESFQDITERVRAMEDLRKSEEKYRTLFASASEGILVADLETKRFVSANPSMCMMLGYSEEELRQLTVFDVHPKEDMDQVLAEFRAQSRGEKILASDIPCLRKDGKVIFADIHAAQAFIEGRKCNIGFFTDITERKRAEEALRESETRVRRKLDAILSPEADISALELSDIVDSEKIQRLMDEFYQLTHVGIGIIDLKGNVLVGTGWQDICTQFHRVNPESRQLCMESDLELSRNVLPGTFNLYRCKNNMWDMATPIMLGDRHVGNIFLGQFLFDDETPDYEVFRQQARRYGFNEDEYLAALDRVPRWSRQMVNAAMSFYAAFAGMIGNLSYSNIKLANALEERKRAEEALRESEAKMRGILDNVESGVALISPKMEILELNRRMREWFPSVEPGQRPACYRTFNDPPREAICEYCPTCKTLQDGLVHEATTQTPRKDSIRNYRIVSSPVFDASGKVGAAIEMVEDITERLSLESQLRQAQKMESVGRLAGGVAHDFNNMLSIINGFAELASDYVREGDPIRDHLQEILNAGRRAATLTRQLLAFSRKQVLIAEVLDLNALIAGIENMLKRLIGEDIELATSLASDLWGTKADRGQIEQIILNLAVNARDAMPDGGKLTIETANVEIDELYAKAHIGATAGPYVMLAVTDNGHGMNAETLAHVFEPFFTTKEKGKGTGLGLATVYGIVKQSGGSIWVYSEVGKGTTFKVYLPRAEEAPAPAKPPRPSFRAGAGETVLVVEDEEAVRHFVAAVLKRGRYNVVEAGSGGEALLAVERLGGRIDMLVTDVVMPQMGGRELAERLAQSNPGMKTLFMSGYPDRSVVHNGVLEKGAMFIQKPFKGEDLLDKIRQILEHGDA